jgi:hypothetical protein
MPRDLDRNATHWIVRCAVMHEPRRLHPAHLGESVPMATRPGRRRFGNIRKRPSGRWQAGYIAPDGLRRDIGGTFDRKGHAERWLSVGRARDFARRMAGSAPLGRVG